MKLDSIAHEDYEKQEHISDVMAMVERIVFRERNAFYEAGYAEGYATRDKEMEDACSRHCEACEDKCLPWKKGCESGLLQGEQIGFDKGKNAMITCKDCIYAGSSDLTTEKEVYCTAHRRLRMKDWFCADGMKDFLKKPKEKKND